MIFVVVDNNGFWHFVQNNKIATNIEKCFYVYYKYHYYYVTTFLLDFFLIHSSYSFIQAMMWIFTPQQTMNTIILQMNLFCIWCSFWQYNTNLMIICHHYGSFHRESWSKIWKYMSFILFDVECNIIITNKSKNNTFFI